jgi:hypothetical protein
MRGGEPIKPRPDVGSKVSFLANGVAKIPSSTGLTSGYLSDSKLFILIISAGESPSIIYLFYVRFPSKFIN